MDGIPVAKLLILLESMGSQPGVRYIIVRGASCACLNDRNCIYLLNFSDLSKISVAGDARSEQKCFRGGEVKKVGSHCLRGLYIIFGM